MARNNLINQVDSVVLASAGSAVTKKISCRGANRVVCAVTCDVNHQLTVGSVNLHMTDGKTVVVVPAALPAGTDSGVCEINCAGVIITVDLSSAANHREIIIRSLAGSGTSGPYAIGPVLPGVDAVSLNLTKAATAGNATYTMIWTAYYL